MRKWKVSHLLFALIVVGLISFGTFKVIQMMFFLHSLGDCGFSIGPFHGKEIEIKLDTVSIDETVRFEHGSFAFIHTKDSIAPIMIHLNVENEIVWAKELCKSEASQEAHMLMMSGCEMQEDFFDKKIHFFNETLYEPGVIYLTSDYNFDYMCLSPM